MISLFRCITSMTVLFSISIAHSNNNCQDTFAEKPTRIENLRNVVEGVIKKEAINRSLPEEQVIRAHDALEDFLDFLDPETLELKKTTKEELSLYEHAFMRQSFLDQENLESQVLKEVNPKAFMRQFLYTHEQTQKNLPPYWQKYIRLYIEEPSFRKEFYKFKLFMIMFGDLFPKLSSKHVSALSSPTWHAFFKKHFRKILNEEVLPYQDWPLQLSYFIRHYEEKFKPKK